MSEGAVISQTGFVDRSRFRASFSEPAYTRRVVEAPKSRVAGDINSPNYSPWHPIKTPDLSLVSQSSAGLVLAADPVTLTQPTAAVETRLNAPPTAKKKSKLHLATTALAILMVVIGAYFSFVAWQNNQAVHAQAIKLTAAANKAASSPTGNANPAISTVKPSAKAVAAYAVAPTLPKYLKIPAIGVYARILQVGILANGALGTPNNVYDTAWYTGSAQPGQPGATLIDGHVSSWTSNGVFYNLHKLVAGDTIQIVKGDNSVINYQVVNTQTYNSNNVNMQAAITPVDPSVSGLNIITCTGDVIKGTSQFDKRVIVFAKEVQ